MSTGFYVSMIDFGPADFNHILAASLASEMLRESYRIYFENKGRSGAVLKPEVKTVEGSAVLLFAIPGIKMQMVENFVEEFLESTIKEWTNPNDETKLVRTAKFAAAKIKQNELYLANAGRMHSERCWQNLGETCASESSFTERLSDKKILLSTKELALHHLQSTSGRLAIEYSPEDIGSTSFIEKGFGNLKPQVIMIKEGVVTAN